VASGHLTRYEQAMSLELTAILLTSLLQLVGLLILGISVGKMVRENGKMLDRIEGSGAPNFLQGFQIKEVLEEIRRFIVTENARPPQS
jgi:hypothetical protein